MKKIYLFLLFSLFVAPILYASGDTYPYTYTAEATGNGIVYASSSDVFNPTRKYSVSGDGQVELVAGMNGPTNAYQDIILDALPNEGYGFKQWRKVDSNGNDFTPQKIIGTTRKTKSTEQLTKSSTTNFYYRADFEETMVSVSSETPARCQVFIDNEINSIGETVTLTATTNANCAITWKKDGVILSNSTNPLVVTVTGKAHYTASANLLTGDNAKISSNYYRLRSANPNTPNDYVRLEDNWFDLTTIVGSATTVLANMPGRINVASGVLARDLKITQNYHSDPGSIFYVKNASNNEYYVYGQGTHVKELTTGTHHGSSTGDINYEGCNVTILKAGDVTSLAAKIKVSTYDFGTFYFNNNNHIFNVHYTDDSHNTKWYLEPINTDDNYFIPDFSKDVQANGKYYTTLRLPFNCQIVGSDLKAYSITGYPSETGDLATVGVVYSTGNTIPAGLPVVIESTSNTPENNKLKPIDDPSEYISTTATTSTGVTSNITTALYNKYGRHAHDSHNEQPARGDGVGYFTVQYSGDQTLYKLGVNTETGVVGFWTAVANGEQISGNQAYATQQCALFPKEVELNELPTIADQITYKVIEPLTVAYVDATNKVIYAKDDNGADEQSPGINETDFMDEHYGQNTYIDHSNWVAIDASSIDLPKITAGNSRIDVTGKVLALEASPNHTIKATRIEKIDDLGGFVPNTYCVVNFNGSHYQIGQSQYFFAAPLANEIAEIIWAQWDGNDTFVVPSGTGFSGTLNADFDLYNDGDYILKPGSQYRFIGLVNKLTSKDSNYKVYPLYGLKDMTITGIQSVETSGNVVSVKYYNMMGVASDVPFKGMNIVVTTYDNGTRTTSKILK